MTQLNVDLAILQMNSSITTKIFIHLTTILTFHINL